MLEGAITLAAQSSISTEGPRIIGTPSADANVTLTVEKNNPKIPEAAKAADRAVGIHVDDGTENAAPGTIDAIQRGFEPRRSGRLAAGFALIRSASRRSKNAPHFGVRGFESTGV